jgi:selenium-binding protein 1
MSPRTPILLAVLVGALAAAVAASSGRPASVAPAHQHHAGSGRDDVHGPTLQERYLYVSTISQSKTDPDFITVVGADPTRADYGKIVNRVDMPNIGDEVHHYGYSSDQKRLLVPGLFSNRVNVFDVQGDGRRLTLRAVADLAKTSGYVVPHGVMPMEDGRAMVSMIGAATESTGPGGIIEIDDKTGKFLDHFGPGPQRGEGEAAPRYMYDFESLPAADRGISTTFGPPALCGGGIEPTCLGDEVAVWDLKTRKVIQTASLGKHSGALMVHFLQKPGVRRAFINAPGTNAVWLADDDDKNGRFDFQQVLGPKNGLALPPDLTLSPDGRYLYVSNWFGNTVQQFDIAHPFHPVLRTTVKLPHPNMLRISRDGHRLYVTNSLLTTWDNDTDFGPARNGNYGIWLFRVGPHGGLAPTTGGGRPWVSFENVQKKTTRGPAGPHLILFDPSIPLAPGEH